MARGDLVSLAQLKAHLGVQSSADDILLASMIGQISRAICTYINRPFVWAPHGPATQWKPQSKPIVFVEYGFASVDRCTNQPNVFFDAKSTESGTPFWSLWQGPDGGVWMPKRDDLLADMALQAVHDYWSAQANIETSSSGVPMIFAPFCCAWNWDARPFPTFPLQAGVWGDGGNWPTGNWICGKGPAIDPPAVETPPGPGTFAVFPVLMGQGWGVKYAPRFSTGVLAHVSGREARTARIVSPLYDIELNFELLRDNASQLELQQVIGFIGAHAGRTKPFLFAPPAGLSICRGESLGMGDGLARSFLLRRMIGGYAESVQAVTGAATVYLNGLALSSDAYEVSILPASVTFTVAPPSGALLTVDFNAAHLVRFAEDSVDLEHFMSDFWASKSLMLETVRA
ncbi:glycoside hydrolase TIM-barrel-like domain-containing protein [uncultured Rhodoblastus sp.]|uniref:baseplate megatron protein TIM-barrel domain-containing protein n=1 Tax=uncultured Rhodoblastus sp. TaxID=543037 RepID=UPI0025F7F90A|nr:glycoside hydrolase TIM-barrel-like domain-containing protein [uncultured Rhodoblastus sp.]